MIKTKIQKICVQCGSKFKTYPEDSKSRTNKFCGHECFFLNRKGYKHSIKARQKMSKSCRGEKNHQWKGGKTSLKLSIRALFIYRQWRSDVFTRDNYTCQFCGIKGGELNADHIKQFSLILDEYNIKTIEDAEKCEELWNINNGRTLCVPCHKTTDNYAKNTRYQVIVK